MSRCRKELLTVVVAMASADARTLLAGRPLNASPGITQDERRQVVALRHLTRKTAECLEQSIELFGRTQVPLAFETRPASSLAECLAGFIDPIGHAVGERPDPTPR